MAGEGGAEAMADTWNIDDYPEGHSPFCLKNCDHSCHDAYDAEIADQSRPLRPDSPDPSQQQQQTVTRQRGTA